MKTAKLLFVSLGLVVLFAPTSRAESEETALQCVKSASFLAPGDVASGRQYAPEREVQVLHLALDVTPDFKQRTVAGKATIRFKPVFKPVRELKLDAVDLKVESVTCTEKVQGHQTTDKQLIVTFAEPVATDREATLTVNYSAEPEHGIYFRTPEMGYKEGDTHLFSQGEQIEARHWYPCLDAPNFQFTSEVTCRVPEGMTVISNGRLVSEEKDAATGLIAFHWSQEKPHANYLITLCAGYFKKIEDKLRDIPLAFYTPPSEIQYAASSFRGTKEMVEFFEQETGVPYPWPKYDQVCVNDFVAGGMENTSATTLTDYTLFTDATENIRDSEGLVAHELAHQWFGDLVTCKDWSHTWLNEGFATYYESLYAGYKHGRDDLIYELYRRTRMITGITNSPKAIVRRTYDDPGAMFSHLSYQKGSWVLHMLRAQLGEDLYRRCVKRYVERHRYGNVTTEDLRAVIEELSGRHFDQFFDQWLYHAHHPELEASYSWDEAAKLAKVSIRQTQRLSDDVLLFNFPLTIRFKGSFGTVDKTVQVSQKDEDFPFTLDSAPELVRLDPEYTVLAKVSFSAPSAMLGTQLADTNDVPGRLLAIEQLANKKDRETIARLKQALNNDPFYGVRLEAAKTLRTIHSDEALDALLASTKQSDARVREQVMSDIGKFYRDTVCESLRKTLDNEKNPDILAQALGGLGAYSKPETRDVLLKYLITDSFRNELAGAAISAMRAQDDPAYISPLLEYVPKHEAAFTSRGLGQALGALAWLARNEEKKDNVREFLIGYVNSKKRSVQLASINALGSLGDPKAIAVLQTFASASKESREREAATRAIADLRAGRKPADEFKGLRQEILDLQKTTRDFRKELDELKKKGEAKPAPAPAATKAPPSSKAKQKSTVTSPKAR